ncbi:MAG: galactonate dehydratase [Actinomycetota bacterium]|nr:galactonate dehydratase [Actinomycetota bacterium]
MRIRGLEVLTIPDRGDSMMLVVVDAEDGLYGIGEVGFRTRQQAVRGALEHLAPILVGEDATRIEHLWQVMTRSGFYPGDRVLNSAVAAIDIALWDLQGKALGVPVYRLLGGRVRDWVPCYAHVPGEDGPVGDFVDACRELLAQGWRHLRFAVPTPTSPVVEATASVRAAVERFFAAREAVGDDVELLIDVHTRLEPPDALLLCHELEAARPFFVEDPLRAESPAAYRQLRSRTRVPLAVGEQYASKWEFRTVLDEDLVDFVRPDLGIAGGITEARKIAAWAEGHYIRTATHNPLGPVMTAACTHFNVACANFGIQEQHDHGPRPDLDRVFTSRPEVTGGRAVPSEAPGLGVDIDRAVARELTARAVERPQLRRPDGSFTNW